MSPAHPDPLDPDAIRWLTPEIVRELHDAVLVPENLAGESSVRPIDAALARVEQRAHYGDLALGVLQIACAYVVAIARAHAFNDGNKRTAAIAADVFLSLNGYELVGLDDNAEAFVDLVERVASGEADEDALCDWLAPYLEVVTDDPDGIIDVEISSPS